MSVAKWFRRSLLYSGSDLKAVYRVPPGAGSKLHDPVLPGSGAYPLIQLDEMGRHSGRRVTRFRRRSARR